MATEEQVRMMIAETDRKLREDLGQMLSGSREEVAAEIVRHREELQEHRSDILDQQSRINALITDTNTKHGVINVEITRRRSEMTTHEAHIVDQQQQMSMYREAIEQQAIHAATALDETKGLDQRLGDIKDKMDTHVEQANALFKQADELIASVRKETMNIFNETAKRVELMVEGAKSQMGGESAHGGGGRDAARNGKDKSIDKQNVPVWKLPEEPDKMLFRHWLDAVDMNSEMVHGFKHASLVLNQIRRSKAEITKPVFEACVAQASLEIQDLMRGLEFDPEGSPGDELLSCPSSIWGHISGQHE